MEDPATIKLPVTSPNAAATPQVVIRKHLPDWSRAEGKQHFVVCDDINDKEFPAIFPGSIKNYYCKEHPQPTGKQDNRRLGKKQQERDETYCFGYINFYAGQGNRARIHSIFNGWEKEGMENVYISPAPMRLDEAKEFISTKALVFPTPIHPHRLHHRRLRRCEINSVATTIQNSSNHFYEMGSSRYQK